MFIQNKETYNQKHFESLAYPKEVKNAVLVCRLGNGYFSKYFKEYASREKKYSHIGIVSKENDTLYVYHSEASELTGVGFVKREKLDLF